MCTASAAQLLFSFSYLIISVCTFSGMRFLFAPSHRTEPVPGLEPGTSSLPRKCSTTELHRHSLLFFCRISIGLPLRNSFSPKPFFGKPITKVAINYRYNNNSERKLFTDSLFTPYFLLSFALSICLFSASMLVSTASSNDAAVFSANRSFPGIPKRMEANLSFPSLLFTSFKTTSA